MVLALHAIYSLQNEFITHSTETQHLNIKLVKKEKKTLNGLQSRNKISSRENSIKNEA